MRKKNTFIKHKLATYANKSGTPNWGSTYVITS